MQPSGRLKAFTVIGVIFIGSGASLLLDTAWYQRSFHPESYWSNQVDRLELAITKDRANIARARTELRLLEASTLLRLEQARQIAIADGSNPEQHQTMEREILSTQSELAQQQIELHTALLEAHTSDLKAARLALTTL